MPLKFACLNTNYFDGAILALSESLNDGKNQTRHEASVLKSFDLADTKQLPGQPTAIASFNNYFFVAVQIGSETGKVKVKPQYILLTYHDYSNLDKAVYTKQNRIMFDSKVTKLYVADSALFVQTEVQGLYQISLKQIENIDQNQGVKVSNIMNKNYTIGQSVGVYSFTDLEQRILAVIDSSCTVTFFEQQTSKFIVQQKNDRCRFLYANSNTGQLIFLKKQGFLSEDLLLAVISKEKQIIEIGSLKLDGNEKLCACVSDSKIILVQSDFQGIEVLQITTQAQLKPLPDDQIEQHEFIHEMPSLLVADSLSQKHFKVVAETYRSLLKKESDVKIELDNLLAIIKEFLDTDINPQVKSVLLRQIEVLDGKLQSVLIVFYSLLKRQRELGERNQSEIRSQKFRQDDQREVEKLSNDIQRIKKLKTIVGKGLYHLLKTDFIQAFRPFQTENMIKAEMAQAILENIQIQATLPLTKLKDFIDLMDSDISENLQYSLGLIQYHMFMIKENEEHFAVPDMVSEEVSEVVSACRQFDKSIMQNDQNTSIIIQQIRAIFNASLQLVTPNQVLDILVKRKIFEPAMSLIQREDIMSQFINSSQEDFEKFLEQMILTYQVAKTEQMWFVQIQRYEAKIMEMHENVYERQVEKFIEFLVQKNRLVNLETTELSKNQDSIIIRYLKDQHPDLAVGMLFWQKKTSEAITNVIKQQANSGLTSILREPYITSCIQFIQKSQPFQEPVGVESDVDMISERSHSERLDRSTNQVLIDSMSGGSLSDFFFGPLPHQIVNERLFSNVSYINTNQLIFPDLSLSRHEERKSNQYLFEDK